MRKYLPELEGLRGLAALWVLLYHVGVLTGIHIFFLRSGMLGVDVFILISGFIMVHQYELRKQSHPWTAGSTMRGFWLRRYFRIAPLYYLLLLVSFLVMPMIVQANALLVSHPAGNTATHGDVSIFNFLIHCSFAFGAIPQYAQATALPDWTLGLEMEFYLIFPFLMLIPYRRSYAAMVLAAGGGRCWCAF
jgi:peptidoglycan/LPS O-acetylase OafA/YrhL